MAITNTAATLGGIAVPIFVGAVTHGNVFLSFYFRFSDFHSLSFSKQLMPGALYFMLLLLSIL